VFIPIHSHPQINFIGLLVGPGAILKSIEEKSGAKVAIRGMGTASPSGAPPTDNDLHVLVTGDTQTQVDTAVEEIKHIISSAITPGSSQS